MMQWEQLIGGLQLYQRMLFHKKIYPARPNRRRLTKYW